MRATNRHPNKYFMHLHHFCIFWRVVGLVVIKAYICARSWPRNSTSCLGLSIWPCGKTEHQRTYGEEVWKMTRDWNCRFQLTCLPLSLAKAPTRKNIWTHCIMHPSLNHFGAASRPHYNVSRCKNGICNFWKLATINGSVKWAKPRKILISGPLRGPTKMFWMA